MGVNEAPHDFNYNYMGKHELKTHFTHTSHLLKDENMDLNAAGDIASIEQNTQRSSEVFNFIRYP